MVVVSSLLDNSAGLHLALDQVTNFALPKLKPFDDEPNGRLAVPRIPRTRREAPRSCNTAAMAWLGVYLSYEVTNIDKSLKCHETIVISTQTGIQN
jgi:hypothetical protein